MIPQSFIQDVLNRADIVEVVGRHVPLKKAGANYAACCPFHSEKSPSFTVSPAKQFYHCFGCGAHGSAIGFLMEYGGISYVEAIRELAGSLGMKVPEETSQDQPPRKDLAEYMEKAVKYYKEELKKSPQAIEYLKKRGLSGEIAARFGLGFAPSDWRNLAKAFPDYEAKELVECGLVISGEGKRYDRFRDRVMFPIVNAKGKIIGFGGRVIGEGEPKYLNSPETPLFEKGRELYGLFQARRFIQESGRILVVEGYMDVVALAQSGIGYGVATLGTATTPSHVEKLLRQSDKVVFCFDGDNAGRKAAWRALENCLPSLSDHKQISFLFLPQGEDPDSYVRKFGKEALEKEIDGALPLSVFLLNELSARNDLKSEEGKAGFLHEMQPYFSKIRAPMLSLLLKKRIAELSGVDSGELDSDFQIKRSVEKPLRLDRKSPNLVRQMIELLLHSPSLASLADSSEIDSEAELSGVRKNEMVALKEMLDFLRDFRASSAGIIEHFRKSGHAALFDEIRPGLFILEELNLKEEEFEKQFSDAWSQFLGLLCKSKIEALHKKPQMSEEDKEVYRNLLKRQVKLQKL